MKIVKIIATALLVYVGIVFAFESLIGYFQPADQSTLVITTTDDEGDTNTRVLSRLTSAGQIYVAANHWPRAWYNAALENPDVMIAMAEGEGAYTAVPITGAEHDRVQADNPTGFGFRLLTGFPPRYFVRLDPR